MARQRVQVEGPTSAAQLRAVASPVETYVRPAEQPNIRTDLEYFISAISPAVQADAQIRKEKALKLQREAEKGIAVKRAADVSLGMSKAQRLATQDFWDNEDEYYSMSEEEIVDRRARIMQPYYERAEASGDQLLIDAFKQDNEAANLLFFTKVYDPAKRKRVFLDDMDALTEELIAISNTKTVLNDIDSIATPQEQTLAKVNMIDNTINKYQAASNYSFRAMNDYIFQNVVAPRVAANGRDALYRWAEQKKLFNVSRYQSAVKTMNNELAVRDKALLKQQDPAAFQQSITSGIDSFFTALSEGRSVNVGYLQIGNIVSLPSGATKTITETDVVNSFEVYAASKQLSPALRLDFYKRTGFIPTREKNVIDSGKSFFKSGELENERDLNQAAAAFAAMEQMCMAGIDIPTSIADSDTMKRFKVVELWHRDAGMNIKDAFARAQNLDTNIKPSNKLKANITNKIGTMWRTDHGDTVNSFNNIQTIAEDVELIMQSGISDETVALKKAIEIFEKDHVIHTASNGVKISFKQLNTDVGTATDVTSTLDVTAKAIGDNQQIKNIIAQQYPIAENPGVVITNVAERPDIVRISVMDENGIFMGQLATVSKTQLLNDPQLVNNIIAQNIQSAINSGINPDAAAETRSIAEIKSGWYGMPTGDVKFVERISNAIASPEQTPATPPQSKAGLYSMPPKEIVTDEGLGSWIRSVGTAVGKFLFGSDAQSAELQSQATEAIQEAATNPLEFVLNNRYLGLSEKDPDHQKTIAGFMNRAVKGRVKNPSDMQLDSNAWCAAFAGHVLSSLGLASPQRYDALRARSYLKLGRGISIDKAQPGDLVVMKTRLQNGKTQWHAGFFVEHDGGKTFKLLGGNQRDQVNVQSNTVANIAGIRRISNVQKINPDALKAVQRDMTFFGKLQNYLLGYRAK